MSCKKCTEKFVLENNPSTLYFITEFDELVSKTCNFLTNLQLDVKEDDGLVSCFVEDAKLFFSENIDAINSQFNDMEKSDIKLFIEDQNNQFTYRSLFVAKPLQRFVNIIEDKEFFDIINNESITSHFQPIIDMKDNSIYGYETLARGVRDDASLVYPDELFSKSKRNDLNFRLDRLCRESSLKTAATKKVHQKVFINFIPTSIYDPEFCLNSTVKWANQLEFDPSQIVFEVVETELVKDQEHLKSILEYYRKEGFKIALDDVGEGYSSLNMLIELQPDIIKIDRNIIDQIDKNELKQSVYRALFNLARENGITVLAEGVETKYELDMIKSIGVDLVQGYYFAKPGAEPVRKV